MAEPCSLEKSAFSLKLIREAATESFCQLLGSLNLGDVELFVEARLLSLFHYFANVGGDDLHSLCVRDIHSLMLPSAHPMPRSTVVYMIRPRTAHVHLVAQHLQQLPAGTSAVLFHTGDIPTVHYKGELSKAVWKALSEFNATTPPPATRLKKLCIDHMILLDRKLDYIAPLSTPLTYTSLADRVHLLTRRCLCRHEALLAELLGLQDGVVTVGAAPSADGDAATSAAPSSTVGEQVLSWIKHALAAIHCGFLQVTWALNGDDPVFQDIRDKHIQAIGPYLHSTSAVFAEERKHMERLPKASYMQLKTQCLHLYGYEYLHVFESLEAMGFLTTGSTAAAPPTTTPTNPLVAWDLTGHFDCDPCNPDDASFVAGGYCPLLIKLVQAALSTVL
ncbi:hypothetical protein DYB32_005493 [Aphanomyces invadans]|uniref:Uncharacterized protein n=1 Tax=Aphanomyces invadans TaxID=157072 RepID=A0A3R6YY31_9STRA|nr:hypothetical protein DYB32_005493 [Aphanomyces invadans]